MDKAYIPDHDLKWQNFWKEQDLFKVETVHAKHSKPSGKSFCIMMPPPNVTGVLHQGHALMLLLQDVLVRWHRMRGDETLYLPGTDHAAIAVQMQVVKHLEKQDINYKTLGRENFVAECWKWIKDFQPRIYKQIERMGTSCDWSRVRFTLDSELNHSVKHAFCELYKKSLIYRDERLVNWTPKGQTGISDLEVVFEERKSKLWHIKYPFQDGSGFVVVATTRPETLLGDTAVAVHPEDERYQKLIGKKLIVPFVNREIPLLADDFVDKDFGSGAVKITPAHDPNDFECGKRHNLERIQVINKEARIVNGLPDEGAQLAGLDRFEARKDIVKRLKEKNLLLKEEEHVNRVGVSDRFGDVIEPFLSSQWFVDVEKMAEKAKLAVENDELKILPKEFHKQFVRWMENIHDWCISRQLWWGHAIPAYHCVDCTHITVSMERADTCEKCGSKNLEEDPDVLDTWFSSGLWPFSTLGWPNKTEDFNKFYPTQVLETGFDILFFWVARMVMLGIELTDKLPFEEVLMHPMVRDAKGQKMSKSKGNVIDPLEIVSEYGADTFRFTLAALCSQGRDLNLDPKRIEGYRNFVNKVWNATRFVLHAPEKKAGHETLLRDQWIVEKLKEVTNDYHKFLAAFEVQKAAELLYHFIWDDICDWYLELCKNERAKSQLNLETVWKETLKLLHPICPHVSEELWHLMPGVKEDESISYAYLNPEPAKVDQMLLRKFDFFRNVVKSFRTLFAEYKCQKTKDLDALIVCDEKTEFFLNEQKEDIVRFSKLGSLKFVEEMPKNIDFVKKIVLDAELGYEVSLLVEENSLVDLKEQLPKLEQKMSELDRYVNSLSKKLNNDNFLKRAPGDIVDKERIKLAAAQKELEGIKAKLKTLS